MEKIIDQLLNNRGGGVILSLREQKISQKSIKTNINNIQKIQRLLKTIIDKLYIIF